MSEISRQTPQTQSNQTDQTLLQHLHAFGYSHSNVATVDWETTLLRLMAEPNDAYQTDNYGRLALHVSVEQTRPMPSERFLHKLIAANSDALRAKDRMGCTPLLSACGSLYRESSTEVVRVLLDADRDVASVQDCNLSIPLHYAKTGEIASLLIDAFPDGIGTRDVCGNLPLHSAVSSRKARPDVVKVLVEEGIRQNIQGGGGGVFSPNRYGRTPFSEICAVLRHIKTSPLQHDDGAMEHWKTFTYIVQAALSVKRKETIRKNTPMLHAVIELGCPDEVIWHALQMNPSEASLRDNTQRLPLTIAASMAGTSFKVFDMLLNSKYSYPDAAGTPDRTGRLPLHLALESRRKFDDCVELILKYEPKAFSTQDPSTNLFPFMSAAVGQDSSIDLVYKLTQETPWLIRILSWSL